MRASDLEALLGEDHPARLVWGYVEHQDLSRLTGALKAPGGNAGRAAIDPRILFALWRYALAHNLTRMVQIAPQRIGLGTSACAATQVAESGVPEVKKHPESGLARPSNAPESTWSARHQCRGRAGVATSAAGSTAGGNQITLGL